MKDRPRRTSPRPAPAGTRRPAGSYAPPRGRPRGDGASTPPRGRPRGAPASSPSRDATSTRSGPRARAAQQRSFDNPYQRAQRPARDAAPRERLSAPAAIRLDPDVARVFRDAESVNEALRLVMRLARFAGGRPSGPPREYTPRGSFAAREDRPPRPARERRDDSTPDEGPPDDGPHFDEE